MAEAFVVSDEQKENVLRGVFVLYNRQFSVYKHNLTIKGDWHTMRDCLKATRRGTLEDAPMLPTNCGAGFCDFSNFIFQKRL